MALITSVLSPALNPGYSTYAKAVAAYEAEMQKVYIADSTMQDLIQAKAGRFFRANAAHKLEDAKEAMELARIAMEHAKEHYRLLNRKNNAQLFFGGTEAGNGEVISRWDYRFHPEE